MLVIRFEASESTLKQKVREGCRPLLGSCSCSAARGRESSPLEIPQLPRRSESLRTQQQPTSSTTSPLARIWDTQSDFALSSGKPLSQHQHRRWFISLCTPGSPLPLRPQFRGAPGSGVARGEQEPPGPFSLPGCLSALYFSQPLPSVSSPERRRDPPGRGSGFLLPARKWLGELPVTSSAHRSS